MLQERYLGALDRRFQSRLSRPRCRRRSIHLIEVPPAVYSDPVALRSPLYRVPPSVRSPMTHPARPSRTQPGQSTALRPHYEKISRAAETGAHMKQPVKRLRSGHEITRAKTRRPNARLAVSGRSQSPTGTHAWRDAIRYLWPLCARQQGGYRVRQADHCGWRRRCRGTPPDKSERARELNRFTEPSPRSCCEHLRDGFPDLRDIRASACGPQVAQVRSPLASSRCPISRGTVRHAPAQRTAARPPASRAHAAGRCLPRPARPRRRRPRAPR